MKIYDNYIYIYLNFKIGTGFSDEQLEKHTEFFKQHIINKPKPYYRVGDAKPDIWFDAVQVCCFMKYISIYNNKVNK